MRPPTLPISRRWRKASPCLFRLETKALPAAMRDSAQPRMASALAALPLRLITSQSVEPISPIRPRARRTHTGARLRIRQPSARRSLTFRKSPGTIRAPVPFWPPYLGYAVGYGPNGYCGSSMAQQYENITSGGGQRGAKRVCNRRSSGKPGSGRKLQRIRETHMANGGSRDSERRRPRYSRCVALRGQRMSGATTTCSAFPIRTMVAHRAWARHLTGPGGGGTSFSAPDLGWDSSAGEPEDGQRAGQPQSGLLQTRGQFGGLLGIPQRHGGRHRSELRRAK